MQKIMYVDYYHAIVAIHVLQHRNLSLIIAPKREMGNTGFLCLYGVDYNIEYFICQEKF